jgi:CBS-domain-containing membrane protein
VTDLANDKPQTSVIKVGTEVLTKSAKKRLRRKAPDINRVLNQRDEKIDIDQREIERNLTMKENYQR